jgi:hypothetical protein
MSTRKLPPPAPGSERRKHERLEVLAQIDIKRGADVWVVKVTNMSIGGLFVELDTRQMIGVHQGDEVGVFLDLGADAAGQPLQLETRAEVVRVDYGGAGRPAGVGMMFTSSDAATAAALTRVLRHIETGGGQR